MLCRRNMNSAFFDEYGMECRARSFLRTGLPKSTRNFWAANPEDLGPVVEDEATF